MYCSRLRRIDNTILVIYHIERRTQILPYLVLSLLRCIQMLYKIPSVSRDYVGHGSKALERMACGPH